MNGREITGNLLFELRHPLLLPIDAESPAIGLVAGLSFDLCDFCAYLNLRMTVCYYTSILCKMPPEHSGV